jgi:hypothetical protein
VSKLVPPVPGHLPASVGKKSPRERFLTSVVASLVAALVAVFGWYLTDGLVWFLLVPLGAVLGAALARVSRPGGGLPPNVLWWRRHE